MVTEKPTANEISLPRMVKNVIICTPSLHLYPDCATAMRPLTGTQICAIIYPLKAAMKTCPKVRSSERMPLGERHLYPCFCDTTSEPQRRNALPGTPVTVSMSGGHRPQPGWNRGILCIPPLIFRGWVFFIPCPTKKEAKTYGKRKPVHL